MNKMLFHASLSMFIAIAHTIPAYSQWAKTNWPAGANFFNLYACQNKVFARTWDSLNGGRTFLTSDAGAHWTQIASADSGVDILSLEVLNNTILAGTWNGLYCSTSGGKTWGAATPIGICSDSAIWSVAMIPPAFFAGTRGTIYSSSDSGAHWTEARSGIPPGARVTSIITNEESIFAGSAGSGVFITKNGGASWTAINSGLVDKRISQLAVLGTKLFAVTLTGVFVSANNGASWAANAIAPKNINCFLVANDNLYAGTDSSGVFLSADSGATWTSLSSGMASAERIWSLAASSDNVFAGTSSGVWRTPLFKNQVKYVAARLQFSQPRLKMLNDARVTVEFMISQPQTISLEVYDLCGNKLLAGNKKFGPGLQCWSFKPRSIAPGSYIIRLTDGNFAYQRTLPVPR